MTDQTPRVPDLWWSPSGGEVWWPGRCIPDTESRLYVGTAMLEDRYSAKLPADAVKLGDVEALRIRAEAAEYREMAAEKRETAALDRADAFRADIRAVLDTKLEFPGDAAAHVAAFLTAARGVNVLKPWQDVAERLLAWMTERFAAVPAEKSFADRLAEQSMAAWRAKIDKQTASLPQVLHTQPCVCSRCSPAAAPAEPSEDEGCGADGCTTFGGCAVCGPEADFEADPEAHTAANDALLASAAPAEPREELTGHRASCACEDCMPIGTDDKPSGSVQSPAKPEAREDESGWRAGAKRRLARLSPEGRRELDEWWEQSVAEFEAADGPLVEHQPAPDSATEWGYRTPWDDVIPQRSEEEAREVVAKSADGARILVCREVAPWRAALQGDQEASRG